MSSDVRKVLRKSKNSGEEGNFHVSFLHQSDRVAKYGLNMYNICMETIHFEWDENKNLINQEKHGVSFEEAKTVFYDEYALLEYDKKNSGTEDRFRILGLSKKGNVLLVAHCTRENDTIIRIISSRKATPNEKKGYERSRRS